MKILIVEDNEDNLKLFKIIVESGDMPLFLQGTAKKLLKLLKGKSLTSYLWIYRCRR